MEIYTKLGDELRTVKTKEVSLPNGKKAKLFTYGTPSAEARQMFSRELKKVRAQTEFAYGSVQGESGLNAARENLNRIFAALPKLPAGQKYGFARDTVFTLPLAKATIGTSPWIQARFNEEE